MTVFISGMHRSGTSMVANLLHLSGLYLGEEAELIPPDPTNPLGHWESLRFVEINNQILRSLGGRWYLPPSVSEGWTMSEELTHLRERAELLVKEFCGHEHWGWKDPRSSLTLPFWTGLLPELKVVICLRNPLEVVLSLRRRPVFKYSGGNIVLFYARLSSTVANLQRANTRIHHLRKQDHHALRSLFSRTIFRIMPSFGVSWDVCVARGCAQVIDNCDAEPSAQSFQHAGLAGWSCSRGHNQTLRTDVRRGQVRLRNNSSEDSNCILRLVSIRLKATVAVVTWYKRRSMSNA